MKAIGIIGGMGPLATVDLLRKIILLTDAQCDRDHIHVYVDNNTEIPDRTDAIIRNGENPVRYMVRSAIQLEMMGSGVLVMACNTAHYFYDQIVKFVRVPFLNMIDETAKEISRHPHIKAVGLLATDGVCVSGIYDRVLAGYGLTVMKPSADRQKSIMNLIYSVKSGKQIGTAPELDLILDEMENRGAQSFILGCTELPVLFQDYAINRPHFDPTRILALSAIRHVGGKIKNGDTFERGIEHE